MATVPTPLDPTAGDKLSAATFDSGVRDVLKWWMGDRPQVHVYQTTGTTCPNAADQLIGFDTEAFDNDSMHDTAVNNGRIVFTTAGKYDIDIQIQMPTAAYTTLLFMLNVNDGGAVGGGTRLRTASYLNPSTMPVTITFTFRRFFSAGDYMTIWLNQATAAAVSRVTAGTSFGTRVFATWSAVS